MLSVAASAPAWRTTAVEMIDLLGAMSQDLLPHRGSSSARSRNAIAIAARPAARSAKAPLQCATATSWATAAAIASPSGAAPGRPAASRHRGQRHVRCIAREVLPDHLPLLLGDR